MTAMQHFWIASNLSKTLPGWEESTKGITKFEKLPQKAQQYVKEIEKLVGVKATLIATGPKREEIIVR